MFEKEPFALLISAIQLQASGLQERLACEGALAALDKVELWLERGVISDSCAMYHARKLVKDLFDKIFWNV